MLPLEANCRRKLVEEFDDDDLKKHSGEQDPDEQVIVLDPFEDVDIVWLPSVHLIEELAQDEGIEDNRHVGLLGIRLSQTQYILSSKLEHQEDHDLVQGLSENVSPHDRGDDGSFRSDRWHAHEFI